MSDLSDSETNNPENKSHLSGSKTNNSENMSDSSDSEAIDCEKTSDSSDGEAESTEELSFVGLSDKYDANQAHKSSSLKNQLALWEMLLQIRIQFQKCLGAANKLPPKEKFEEMKKLSPELSNKLIEGKNNLSDALDKLLILQKLVVNKYRETRNILKEGSDLSDEIDIQPCKKRKVCEYENDISSCFHKYNDYRNEVIEKWNEIAHVGKTTSYSVLTQIHYALADKSKHSKSESAESNNVFDDQDFYHQLLREYIETKSSDTMDPLQHQRQWLNLENTRKKMKRNIDTKATKGRKIRYAVHSKLVNTMAPINTISYTNESIDKMYSSLFGRGNV